MPEEKRLSKLESLEVFCQIVSTKLEDMRRLIHAMIEESEGPKPVRAQSTEDVSAPRPF
jgi:hypothetical protein